MESKASDSECVNCNDVKVVTVSGEAVRLASTVVIGTVDLGAVGCRTCGALTRSGPCAHRVTWIVLYPITHRRRFPVEVVR